MQPNYTQKNHCMKNLKFIISLMGILLTFPVAAQRFQFQGLNYRVLDAENKTCSVADNRSASGDVAIPSVVEYEGTEYTVTTIGTQAFAYCSNLTSIFIPSSVVKIADLAFTGCYSLQRAEFASIESVCEMDFYGSEANPITHAQNLYINGTIITDLVIPETVKSIAACAFFSCSSLISVTIPKSVTHVGIAAFAYCRNLERAEYASVESLLSIDYDHFDANPFSNNKCMLFVDGKELTDLIIPSTITEIKAYALYNCKNLYSVTIPESVKRIGDNAFWCPNLERAEFASIEIICTMDFGGDMSNPLLNEYCDLYIAGEKIIELVIPATVSEIKQYAFRGGKFTSVTLPNTISSIGNGAFRECLKLEKVIYNTNAPLYADEYLFSDLTYLQATLIMPKDGLEAAKSTCPWNKFKHTSELATSGIDDIAIETEEVGPVFNLQGVKVADSLQGIEEPGIYIVNGKKITIN